ncbi:MAG: hypothetical protein OEL82_07625 [Nitrosopumilus sp.]|nr:hypothetical protein [Nitrosopumilus sp.]
MSIFALAGIMIPSAMQTSYEAGPWCERGDLTKVSDHTIDRNNDGNIYVLKIIEDPSENVKKKIIYVAIDNLICPCDCGGNGV